MNGFINRILFSIASLNIFRRRYFIYKDIYKELFYIKTRKLFYFPMYIHISGGSYLTNYYKKKKAVKNCSHNSKEEAVQTIVNHKRYHSTQPKLRYIRIWE